MLAAFRLAASSAKKQQKQQQKKKQRADGDDDDNEPAMKKQKTVAAAETVKGCGHGHGRGHDAPKNTTKNTKNKKRKCVEEVEVVEEEVVEEDDDDDVLDDAAAGEEEEQEVSFSISRTGGGDVAAPLLLTGAEKSAALVAARQKKKKQKTAAAAAAVAARCENWCPAMAHLGAHFWTTAGYALTGAYFKGQEKLRLARHHIDSANHFYKHQLPGTIRMFNAHKFDPLTGQMEDTPAQHRMVSSQKDKNLDTNDFNLQICYDIVNLRFELPQMTDASGETRPMWPADALEKARTYAARSKVDIQVTVRHRYNPDPSAATSVGAFETEKYTIRDVDFIQMPVLVNSELCLQGAQRAKHVQDTYDAALADARARGLEFPERHAQNAANATPLDSAKDQDCGGYFIVKGSPKVIISQEHGTENRMHVFVHKKNQWRGYAAQIASVPDNRCVSPKTMEMGLLPKQNLYGHPIHMALPASRMKKGATISLFLFFRAMGVMSDRHICEIILGGPIADADPRMLASLRASMYDAEQILKRSEFQVHSTAAAAETAATAAATAATEGQEEEQEETTAAVQDPMLDLDERNDELSRERCVSYIQSTLNIYDTRVGAIAPPLGAAAIAAAHKRVVVTARGGAIMGGPKPPKVEKYTPDEAYASCCYMREDHVATMAAILPMNRTYRACGANAAAAAKRAVRRDANRMDSPPLASPPKELIEFVQTASHVQRQAIYRHGEARRNIHNEFHKYFRQHAAMTAAFDSCVVDGVDGSISATPAAAATPAPEAAPAAVMLSWSKFMLNILAMRRAHQKRGRMSDWQRSTTLRIMENDVLPHCKNVHKTVFTLGLMANRLLRVVRGDLAPSDRDAYLAKRVEPTGVQLNNLFRNLYLRFQKEFDRQIKNAIDVAGSWKHPRDIFTSENAHQIFNPSLIESGLINALHSGDFSTKQARDSNSGNNNKVGVAQVLNRLNYLATLSHVRRLNTPIAGKNGELVAPRKLHGSTYGFLCPVETPEGRPVGLIKHLSLMTVVTVPQLHNHILYEIAETLASPLEVGVPEGYVGVRLLINGTWVGMARDPRACVQSLRDCKMRGRISPMSSVVFDFTLREIRVCTDAGRLCRPLLRVNPETGKVFLEQKHLDGLRDGSLTWDDIMLRRDGFMDEPVIEYLDVEEQAHTIIVGGTGHNSYDDMNGSSSSGSSGSSSKKRRRQQLATYCEIHPMTLLGTIAGTTPFPQCNQSPRNVYQCAMAKQAIGLTANNRRSADKTVLNMNFPSVPMVQTETSRIIKCDEFPAGQMVTIGIMSCTGFNQEDSIILNQASIDRGLFHCTVHKTEKDVNRNSKEEIERCNPMADPAQAARTKNLKKNSDYSCLDRNGNNPPGTHLKDRQVLQGKRVVVRAPGNNGAGSGGAQLRLTASGLPMDVVAAHENSYEDRSKTARLSEDAYVDMNAVLRDGDGYILARTGYHIDRRIAIGDKVASRSAQKSTDGRDLAPEDMPFSMKGTVLDALLNPHAIPSRMTVSHLNESNFGKVLSHLGLFGDCSAFCEINEATIAEQMRLHGYSSTGTEVFYDGLTGRPFTVETFAGHMFYQRLKHMVNDKCHSRTTGPTVVNTRQPTDGRSRAGGLRLGEMERDCVASHGCADFAVERMLHSSDKFVLPVCKHCGAVAVVNSGDKPSMYSKPGNRIHQCLACDNQTDFVQHDYPYAKKLYNQELMAIGVQTRIL